ncbi:MAG: hypothetical protein J7L71_11580 [Spirochaetaceae bacterium]|nr:hypothetical protein [Spirochaetaceae bacterium]
MKYLKLSKKLLIILILTIANVFFLSAAGKKEQGEYTKVEGLKTWSYTKDISELPDGKYNLIVKGEDTAGNVGIAGPYNVFISAESDLATVNIANPVENMIVSDNLNIVGDAFDDDGIKQVDIKLDDGFYQKCTGTVFWNYYLDLDQLEEGPHIITVRGTDINGLEGIEASVKFTVDKKPPVVTIRSYEQGSVLSGKINITGDISDAGGIEQLLFSENENTEFKKLKTSYNKKTGLWEFSQTFNTNKMEDGTYNYWYKSIDTSGAEGIYSFLFFVDNNAPELTVIEPVEGDRVNGSLGLAGKITDTIGVKSLIVKVGAEQQEVKLDPGNPYWALQMNISADASTKLNVELEAVDFAGNTSLDKIKLINDYSLDLPVLSLFLPEQIGVLQKTISAGIEITDDDQVKGFEYFLDKNESVFIETKGTSVIMLNDIVPGKHTLKLIPYDISEIAGKAVSGSFTVPKVSIKDPELPAPLIQIEAPESNTITLEDFSISGKVSSDSGLQSFEYIVADDPEAQWISVFTDTSSGSFTVDISSNLISEGNHVLEFRAIDSANNISTAYAGFKKDSYAPELTLLTPFKGDTVNGKLTISGKILDQSPNFSYKFSTDGKKFVDTGKEKFFSFDFDYSSFDEKPEVLFMRTEDEYKNTKDYSFPFKVDSQIDIPIVTIQFPGENATLRGEASISGTALDDDGIKTLYFSFDNGDFKTAEGNSTFNIPVPFSVLKDSEHSVQIKAEDINGVFSDTVERKFIISRTGPVIKVKEPSPEIYLKGSSTIKGSAVDSNGIDKVTVSIDNGVSYSMTDGEEHWTYRLDTTLLSDGTHSLYVKAVDKSGSPSFYTTIINIDNIPPEIKLDSPANSTETGNNISFDGRVTDNSHLDSLKLVIQTLEQTKEIQSPLEIKLDPETFMHYELSTENLNPGWYNIRLEAVDGAGNISNEIRSINIVPVSDRGEINIMYPLEGESYNEFVKVEGFVDAETIPESVIILIDDTVAGTADVSKTGKYNLTLDKIKLSNGKHQLEVRSSDINADIQSLPRRFSYNTNGPWILFDQSYGDFLTSRTFITGTLGYDPLDPNLELKIKNLMISYDNGRNFTDLKAANKWKARIETEQYPDGNLPVLIKVVYNDNSSATAKTTLTIDKSSPELKLENVMEDKSYNNSLVLKGSSNDNTGIENVSFLLREGDKNSYEVPSFIQGLYLDFHALGATYGEFGAGLTFFEDNVKLQASIGLAPPGRFSGLVLGGKLLANIATIPYSYIFGPDLQNFSMAFTVGANFSYFTMSDTDITFTDKGVVLGSVLGQWELVRYRIPELSMFNTYSLYVEGALWFISSDVQAGVVPTYSIGSRIGIF